MIYSTSLIPLQHHPALVKALSIFFLFKSIIYVAGRLRGDGWLTPFSVFGNRGSTVNSLVATRAPSEKFVTHTHTHAQPPAIQPIELGRDSCVRQAKGALLFYRLKRLPKKRSQPLARYTVTGIGGPSITPDPKLVRKIDLSSRRDAPHYCTRATLGLCLCFCA